jgi:hypothetical protein
MKHFLTILFLIAALATQAQSALDLAEDKPTALNGIEYSYTISNERDEETYSRYEITITAQNKSGCMIIYFKKDDDDLNSIFEGDPSAIARFECLNATGKRLTSKGGNVKAKPFFVPYTKDGNTKKIEGGYLLKNGSRATSTLIVIVPKGERPKFKVKPQDFSEFVE